MITFEYPLEPFYINNKFYNKLIFIDNDEIDDELYEYIFQTSTENLNMDNNYSDREVNYMVNWINNKEK